MSVHPRHRLAMLAGLIGLGELGQHGEGLPARRKMAGRPWWKGGTSRKKGPPYNRAQEQARRARQVERGQLRAANGLVQ